MRNPNNNHLLEEWSDELNEALGKSNALCIALFNENKKLDFATPAMTALFKVDPHDSFINPSYDILLSMKSDSNLVFEGLLTIGSVNSKNNNTIIAHVFVKNAKLLVIGGSDSMQLLDQYKSMHSLNSEINNLQRQVLKEKIALENTLKQLSDTNAALTQANATKDKFFSIIAHDLRSPFNSIIGFSDMLVKKIVEKDYEKIDYFSQIINQSSKNAMELLMNLMEWSRSQTDRIEYNPEKIELNDFINKTTAIYDHIASEKSIHIKKNIPEALLTYADKAMISTIFRNLITNAIKFTQPEGEIIVSAIKQNNKVVCAVSDTGVGIPKKNIEKLFRIDQCYTTLGTGKEKGTGLGLILCKEFVEKHGGEIWVESEEGKGSKFNFSLAIQED